MVDSRSDCCKRTILDRITRRIKVTVAKVTMVAVGSCYHVAATMLQASKSLLATYIASKHMGCSQDTWQQLHHGRWSHGKWRAWKADPSGRQHGCQRGWGYFCSSKGILRGGRGPCIIFKENPSEEGRVRLSTDNYGIHQQSKCYTPGWIHYHWP